MSAEQQHLLLQKNPELHNHEIKSLLLTTVKPVSDAYGREFSVHESGSGRLDIENAYNAKLIITPPNLVVNASSKQQIIEKQFELKVINGLLDDLDVKFEGPELIKFSHILEGNKLQIAINVSEEEFGDHEGKIIIMHENIRYLVPILIHYTQGSVSVEQQNQEIFFEIYHPEKWIFAKISIINSNDGKENTITTTPNKKASFKIHENSEYWIDAKIRVNGNSSSAYNVIKINSIPENYVKEYIIAVPEKQISIIAVMLIGIAVFGLIKKRQTN